MGIYYIYNNILYIQYTGIYFEWGTYAEIETGPMQKWRDLQLGKPGSAQPVSEPSTSSENRPIFLKKKNIQIPIEAAAAGHPL